MTIGPLHVECGFGRPLSWQCTTLIQFELSLWGGRIDLNICLWPVYFRANYLVKELP